MQPSENMRAIAYSMDALIPGIYIWAGKFTWRAGGCTPDDQPYRYPGMIHSKAGIAIILPGYRIFTSYRDTLDPSPSNGILK